MSSRLFAAARSPAFCVNDNFVNKVILPHCGNAAFATSTLSLSLSLPPHQIVRDHELGLFMTDYSSDGS